MPSVGSIAAADKPHAVVKGIFSLVLVVLLCLPSLVGAVVFLINLFLSRDAQEWDRISGVLVAMGGIFGRPLVALAAVVGATMAFRANVPAKIMYAHLIVVGLGMIASLFYLFRLGV